MWLSKLIPSQLKNYLLKVFGQQSVYHFQPRVLDYDKKKKIMVSNTAFVFTPENIKFGKMIFVWHYSILDGTAELIIEDGVQIGAWAGIFTHSNAASRVYGYKYYEIPDNQKKALVKETVKIGKFSVIGPHSIIMPGTVIGKGVLVKPYSYVPFGSNIPDFSIVEGNPAVIIGDTRKLDKRLIQSDEELFKLYEEWQ